LNTKSPSLLDVSDSSGRRIEDRGHTPNAPTSGSRHHTRGKFGSGLVNLGVGLTGVLLVVALVSTLARTSEQNLKRPRPSTQPISPSQPNNPPRDFVGREQRDPGRGFAVDTSGEPYPNLHLDNIADDAFTTTAGSSEARSISDQDG